MRPDDRTPPIAPPRVLWVTKGLGPGGAERLLSSMAPALAPDVRIECAFVLPGKDHLVGDLEAAGVRTICLSRRPSDPWWPVRLARLVRAGDHDVVHVHSPLPGSVARLAARSVPASRRPALMTTEHNRWATHRLPTRALNRTTIRWDDTTFCVTDEIRTSMSPTTASRTVTLRHGIDVVAIADRTGRRAEMRRELGLAPDAFVAGTVANFRPQKGHPDLLAAARRVTRQRPDVRFVVVGQGPQEHEIRRLRDQLGLTDPVILTGYRGDAVDVMGACDVFVLASRWEGLPVAVMEACALGLPIVATAVGGVAEELTDGKEALLVPPGDPQSLATALLRVVDDPALAARLGSAARAKAAGDFDASRSIAVVRQAYRVLAAHRRRTPTAATTATATATTAVVRERGRRVLGGPASIPPVELPAGVEVRPATLDDRPAVLELLARSLGAEGDARYAELVAWKHDENPFGPSPMWVATERGRVLAVRAFLRWEFERGREILRAVRAVDTATDPAARGRGLFRALTLHGLAELAAEGVDFVFNTPNDQSRPGYLSMGWREIGSLPAALAPAHLHRGRATLSSRVPADRWSLRLSVGEPAGRWLDRNGTDVLTAHETSPDLRRLRTRRTNPHLRWRYGGTLLGYRVVEGRGALIVVRARRRGTARELVLADSAGDPRDADALARATARAARCDHVLRLGGADLRHGYVSLPGGGPLLTWRSVGSTGPPPLPNWDLTLGDVELF